MNPAERVTAILDREIEASVKDLESSEFIEWLRSLRDELVAAVT